MIYIGLGSNLSSRFGPPEQTLRAAAVSLSEHGLDVVALSRLWRSAPVPLSDQPWYCNAAAQVETTLKPREIFLILKRIEAAFGRAEDVRNAPRILDLDLLAWHDRVAHAPSLTLPHPRLHERAFVLYPLQEIAPDWRHPGLGKDIGELIGQLPAGQRLEPLDDPS